MARTAPTAQARGLARILHDENTVSDLLQELTDLWPAAWTDLVGFVPFDCTREERLDGATRADLVLRGPGDARAIVEVKLGHVLSADQQRRYEELAADGERLVLTALAADRARVAETTGRAWTFVPLAELFDRWATGTPAGAPATAAALGSMVADVLRGWDELIATATRATDPIAFNDVPQKFARRLIAEDMVRRLEAPGRPAHSGLNAAGTEHIIEAWCEIGGDPDRWFHAEMRVPFSGHVATLRFGVDYDTEDTEECRRECYQLASSLSEAISAPGLKEALRVLRPDDADRLVIRGLGRKRQAHEAWEHVLRYGYGTAEAKNRRSVRPEFVGDGTLRHQASVKVDISEMSPAAMTALLDATLQHLQSAHASLSNS